MDVGDDVYVWLRGTGTLVHDIDKVKELWSAMTGAWFPGGPEDPNLALLRITLSSAEHWEPPQGKVMQFVEIVTAALTHHKPEHEGVYRRLHF